MRAWRLAVQAALDRAPPGALLIGAKLNDALMPQRLSSRKNSRESGCANGRAHTNLLCALAASIKLANSGCGSNGRLFSSGWNCTPMNQG